jgi:hypothetical protein
MKILWMAALLAIALTVLYPVGAAAAYPTANQTSINETYCWRNVLETGDMLILSRYAVTYNNMTPMNTTDISETYLFRLMDTTNTHELGAVEAYPFIDRGFGVGAVSWYFSNATAPAWGGQYWIRIEGKVPMFTSPTTYSTEIAAASYSTLTDENEVAEDLASTVLSMADDLGLTWIPNILMTLSVETGTILSTYGETYFRSVIPGLQGMAPSIFEIGFEDPDYDAAGFNTTAATTNQDRLKPTGLGTAIQGFSDLFDWTFSITAAIPIIIVCIALIIIGAVQGNMLSGLVSSSIVLVAASWAGWFPPMVMAIIAFFCVAYIMFHMVYKGSSG